MNLPIEFTNRMKTLLGSEYDDYIQSFNEPASKAVHLNTYVCSKDTLLASFPEDFSPLGYCDNGFKSSIEKIGQSPLHHAGVLYSQDPGALMPVSSIPFDFSSEDIVLDMCSAPGGKSSQLAIKLKEANAFLVSNEINKSRNTILRSNMERMGYTNQLITCMSAEEIASAFPHTFSFILVDAPCSGEGMFRKYPESIDEWSLDNVALCSERQKEILSHVINALRPGGHLLYSTCTYSKEENEDIIYYLLNNFNLEIIDLNPAILDYSTKYNNEPGVHFYPHKAYGEGQYMCLLRSKDNATLKSTACYKPAYQKAGKNIIKIIKEAMNESIIDELPIYMDKENLYIIPDYPFHVPVKGVTRLGIFMGQIVKNRFEPSHAFFKAYGHKLSNTIDLSDDTEQALRYLRGEELISDKASKGYGVFTYYGGILGGFKSAGGRLKNHYPKGLRNNK